MLCFPTLYCLKRENDTPQWQGSLRMIFILTLLPKCTHDVIYYRYQVNWKYTSIEHILGYGFGTRETHVQISDPPPNCCKILGNAHDPSDPQITITTS